MRLTVPQAASLLDAPEERVYDWIEDDKLPAQRVRGQYRINRTELLEWATERGLTVAPRVFVQEDGPETPPVAVALAAGGIHRVASNDLTAALTEIVNALPVVSLEDRIALLQFVLARQDFGLNAIAENVAAPQVRTPAVITEQDAIVSLTFLERPLALAGAAAPITAIFFLASPTVHAHLTMLAKLAACMKDSAFAENVRRRAPADAIIRAAAEAEERLR